MIKFVDEDDNQNFEGMLGEKSKHNTTLVPNSYRTKVPNCMIFSMEACITRSEK